MKVVLLEPLAISEEKLNEFAKELRNKGHEFEAYDDRVEKEEVIVERAKDADVIIITNLPLSKNVINSLPKLKMISVAFTGVDHIDLESCEENNIVVSNAPGYSTHSVAELAIGLMINVMRNMNKCDKAVRSQETRVGLIGNEIHGKTLGIIGTGTIGMRVAEIAKALGCNLIAYSRSKAEKAKELGIEYLDIEEVFEKSDIITLHVPHTPETEGMINEELINKMKESAIFINTARGPIVDSKALAEALNEEKIAGAAIDVYEMEPPIPEDHPLVNAKNTVLTPHVAFATPEAFVKRAEIVFENIKAWDKGETINQIV
ncbi:MAG: 2-hydroxyacid dehydrogenase [Halanaerobiales bacterium]